MIFCVCLRMIIDYNLQKKQKKSKKILYILKFFILKNNINYTDHSINY